MTKPNNTDAAHAATDPKTGNQIAALIADCDLASDHLAAAKREAMAEYSERIRKMRDAKIALHHARETARGELFDIGPLLSPELVRLLSNPVYGL